MACSCDNLLKSFRSACIFLCVLVVFLVGGIFTLGQHAVSEFQNYRKEDYNHVSTSCVMESVNVSAVRDCTYDEIHSTFPCVQVTVSYKASVKGRLFRSSEDARDTQHQCLAYECEKSGIIYTYVNSLNSEFECFYNPEKPYFVYIESKDGRLVNFTFACFIIISLSPLLVFLCCWYKLSRPKWSTCRKYVSRSVERRRTKRSADLWTYIRQGRIDDVKKNLKKAKINTQIGDSKISPLALAAQHGQYAVMVDLFRRGANIHYIQRGTEKTILHFACENGKKEIIDFCFRNHVPLNALDHMKRTPLITYVEMGLAPENAVETLNHLIKIGADVTSKDKDNYTALHYACKTINLSNTDIKRKIISVLIRAGCTSNNATLSKRNYQTYPYNDSPLCVLLYHDEFTLVTLLIEAGYDLKRDPGLSIAIPSLSRHVQEMLKEEQQSPPSLFRLCRTCVRKSVGGIRLQQKLKLLPMPERLIKYLQLKLH